MLGTYDRSKVTRYDDDAVFILHSNSLPNSGQNFKTRVSCG